MAHSSKGNTDIGIESGNECDDTKQAVGQVVGQPVWLKGLRAIKTRNIIAFLVGWIGMPGVC